MAANAPDLRVLGKKSSDVSPLGDAASVNVPPPASRWKSRVLLPVFLLGACAALLAYAGRDALWTARPVRVEAVVVKSGPVAAVGQVAFQAPGWVEADPYSTYVTALADGVVKEVLVLEGARVKKGQLVARLVDDDARLALAQAAATQTAREADLKAAQADLKAAQREWDHPVERERAVAVAQQALAETRAELQKLKAELAVAGARVAELEEQLRREIEAGVGDAIPEFQVVQTRLKLKTLQAERDSVQARKPILEEQIKRLDAELKAARENRELRIPETRALEEATARVRGAEAALLEAQARVAEAKLRLARMDLFAINDGIVMQRMIVPGSKLMLGMDDKHSAHALHLYDPQNLQVRVDVPLADAAKISVGQKADVVVEVLPDRTFTGEITRIVHEADIQKNTLQVKVRIDNPVDELKPEMLARVKFYALSAPATKEGATAGRLFVPEDALRKASGGEGEARVWLADRRHGVAEDRAVTLGAGRQEGWVEIAEGLKPGDEVIVSGADGLADGAKIRVLDGE